MKNKLINFRITNEFDVFLESIWRISKYKKLGIKSKSDLFRYSVLKTIGKDLGVEILNEFKSVDEIHNYLNPKQIKEDLEIQKEINKYINKKMK